MWHANKCNVKEDQGSHKEKYGNFMLILMELFETNRMRHFAPFYDDFSYRKLT